MLRTILRSRSQSHDGRRGISQTLSMTHAARPLHVSLADLFTAPGAARHPLLLRLTSGEEFECHTPCFDVDQLVLVVTTFEGIARRVRPAEIEALYERRPLWPAYASLGLVTVIPGAAISALVVPLVSPLSALDGARFGALRGIVAPATLSWVLPPPSP